MRAMTRLSKEDHSTTCSRGKLVDNKFILAIIPALITGAVTYFARARTGSVFHKSPSPEDNSPSPEDKSPSPEDKSPSPEDKSPSPEDKSPSLSQWLQGTAGIVAALGVLLALLFVA